MELYRVIEVGRMLGVSKVTIYKKIEQNKKMLKPHIQKRSGIMYVSDEGVDIIKGLLVSLNSEPYPDDHLKREYLTDLEQQIDYLTQLIIEKKKMIDQENEEIEHYKTQMKILKGKNQYIEKKYRRG